MPFGDSTKVSGPSNSPCPKMGRTFVFTAVVLLFAVVELGGYAQGMLLPKKLSQDVKEVYEDFKDFFHESSFKVQETAGKYNDCLALWKVNRGVPGIYNIYVLGKYQAVRCYYNGTKAYTIIQQRVNGNEDFNRRLADYANGFGNVAADHWIGLNTIRRLVELGNNQLQIVMTSFPPSSTVVVNYGYFSIGTQAQGWPLSVGNFYGPVPDDLSYSNGRIFYTSDVPDPNNCAVNQRGGWWYNYCSYAFLNGYYYRTGKYTPPGNFYDGIYWKDWLGYDYSLLQVTMAITHA